VCSPNQYLIQSRKRRGKFTVIKFLYFINTFFVSAAWFSFVVIPCLLVNSYRSSGEARFSKTVVNIYQLTWHNIPEDLNLLSTPLRKPQILYCIVLYCILLYGIISYWIISECILPHPSWQNLYRTHPYNFYTYSRSYESSYLSQKSTCKQLHRFTKVQIFFK